VEPIVTDFLRRPRAATFGCAVLLLLACTEQKEPGESKASAVEETTPPKPRLKQLYVPQRAKNETSVDLSGSAHESRDVSFAPGGMALPRTAALGACAAEMVLVAGSFCIDRFEFSLVDRTTGQALSPHYPPEQKRISELFERWTRKAPQSGRALGRGTPVPVPPAFSLQEAFAPRAVSERGSLPAGYLNRGHAEAACKNAGKRLCRRQEWVKACRGEANTQFPYGDSYEEGICNVHRGSHPARLLHGDASRNHLDPRLLLTEDEEGPLLKRSGEKNSCASRWGNDAIYDMVGNVDEWIEEPSGSFVGGFFSRATRAGCSATIDSHSPGYLDYSLGGRCCSDLTK